MYLKTFLHSFSPKKEHFISLAADGSFLLIAYFLINAFSNFLKEKSSLLQGARTQEQFQQLLASMGNEQMQAFLLQVKSLLAQTLLGLAAVSILLWLLFSFTRAFLWNYLTEKKLTKHNYWRWNWLHLLLGASAVLFFFVGFIFITLFSGFLAWLYLPEVIPYAKRILQLGLFLFFLLFSFLLAQHFTREYRIFLSLHQTFLGMKRSWKSFWKIWFSALVVGLVPFVLSFFFQEALAQQNVVFMNSIFSLLFLSWFRIYTVKFSSALGENKY